MPMETLIWLWRVSHFCHNLQNLILHSFLNDFQMEMQKAGQHVILLSDNCPSHMKFNQDDYPNVRLVFF